MADPDVIATLTTCPLDKLSVTDATMPVIHSIRSIRSLRILRLIMQLEPSEHGTSDTVAAEITEILHNSASTLVQLTLSNQGMNISIQLGTAIVFPNVQYLTWHVGSYTSLSPVDLHRAFPNVRSISTSARILTRRPEATDVTPPSVMPIAVAGDHHVAEAYARLGSLLHAMPTTPFPRGREGEGIRSLCIPAGGIFPRCAIHKPTLEQLEFLQIYQWPTDIFSHEDVSGTSHRILHVSKLTPTTEFEFSSLSR